MPNAAKFNLPFTFAIPDSIPTSLPPELKPVISDIFNALQQVQFIMHTYLGVGQRIINDWPSINYTQSLHRFSPWRFYAPALEAVSYGRAINLVLDAGVVKFRNANATNNTKPCHGFCTTINGLSAGEIGEVILCQGLLTGISGLTVGARYFLATANGLLTTVAPVAAGNIEQAVGIALDSTALLFCTDFDFIQH
jgi:hypothetical protein